MNTQIPSATAPTVFQFNQNYQVRVIIIDNEPWFCLRDVCKILDLDQNRPVSRFQMDDKGVEKYATPSNGGNQEMIFISEPNLYRVIFRSNKTEAKQFQNWVFNDVLPSIRKNGYYHKTDKHDLITAKQKEQLYQACRDACFLMPRSQSAIVWLVNGLRGIYQIDSLEYLPAKHFDAALLHIKSKKDDVASFTDGLIDVQELFCKTVLGDNVPFTGVLKRKFFERFNLKLVGKVDWQDIIKQLDEKNTAV
jgi:prophage antirepressor-like protein